MGDHFVSSFDDRTLGIYRTEMLELDHVIPLNNVVKSMTAMDVNTFICATDENKMLLIDKRMNLISLTIPTG